MYNADGTLLYFWSVLCIVKFDLWIWIGVNINSENAICTTFSLETEVVSRTNISVLFIWPFSHGRIDLGIIGVWLHLSSLTGLLFIWWALHWVSNLKDDVNLYLTYYWKLENIVSTKNKPKNIIGTHSLILIESSKISLLNFWYIVR